MESCEIQVEEPILTPLVVKDTNSQTNGKEEVEEVCIVVNNNNRAATAEVRGNASGVFSGCSSSRSSQQYLNIGHSGYAPIISSKSSLNKLLSGSGLAESDSNRAFKLEGRLVTTPRRGPRNNNQNIKVAVASTPHIRRADSAGFAPVRSCDHHCFLTDITDVKQMEQGLLQLLDDFHSGRIQAFGKDCTLEKMENVRKQQERLARLHFDLNTKQEMFSPKSEEGQRMAKENLSKLIENLQQLSMSIEQLQTGNPGIQTDV